MHAAPHLWMQVSSLVLALPLQNACISLSATKPQGLLYTLLIPLSQCLNKFRTLTHPEETVSEEFIIHIINRTVDRTNHSLLIKCSCINTGMFINYLFQQTNVDTDSSHLQNHYAHHNCSATSYIYVQPHLTTTNCAWQQQHMSTTYTKLEKVVTAHHNQQVTGLKLQDFLD